jgi:HAD superfamily hydrolase (TIGR01509 family)
LNSEVEHQTAEDTTVGGDKPLGERSAWAADHVASGSGTAETKSAFASLGSTPALADHAFRTAPRVATRLAKAAAVQQVGVAPGGLAVAGLALLRRGRALPGVAMLAAAGGVAWSSRRRARVKAVLFDIDGTLADSNDDHVRAWSEAFRQHGHDVAPDRIAGQIGKGGDLLVPALLPGLSDDEQEALTKLHGVVFKARYLDGVKPFPGAVDLLRRTHRAGKTVVLASSASAEEVDHYLDLFGVRDIVAATTSSDEVATSKPAGDIFAAALKKAKVRAEEAIVVGDTPYDIEAARKRRVRTVALRSGGFDDAALKGAVRVYDDAAALVTGFAKSPLA